MIKRKTIIVDRSLQLRYAGIIIAIVIVTIGIIILSALQYKLWIAPPGSGKIIFGLALFLVIVFIGFGVLVTIFSIFVSHKFAGPMYRVKRILEAITEGDLTQRVHLREKDELSDLRDELNKTIISIQKRVKDDKQKVQEVLQIVQTSKTKLSEIRASAETEELKLKLTMMENKLNEIGMHFKV